MNLMLGLEEGRDPMRMVVKVAGALLDDAAAMKRWRGRWRSSPAKATKSWSCMAGKNIYGFAQAHGIESRFIAGLRVTDRETAMSP